MNDIRLFILTLAISFCLSNTAEAQNGQPHDHGEAIVSEIDAQLELIDDVEVASRDSGKVTNVLAKPNEGVSVGQAIVSLDVEFFKAEAESARKELDIATKESKNDTDLRFAKKSRELNRKNLERSCQAFESFNKSISKTELERLELELERSGLSAEQALHTKGVNELRRQLQQERLNAALLRLKYRTIGSPLDGEIAQVMVQPGEWVQAGQPVARVISLKTLRVSALVSQADVLKIRRDQPAEFTAKVGDQNIATKGVVSFVSREINPVAGDCIIWVDVDNSDKKLLPGMRGKVKIFPQQRDSTTPELPELDHRSQLSPKPTANRG